MLMVVFLNPLTILLVFIRRWFDDLKVCAVSFDERIKSDIQGLLNRKKDKEKGRWRWLLSVGRMEEEQGWAVLCCAVLLCSCGAVDF
jgi:hypothetical protein